MGSSELRKELGLALLTAIGIGGVIGSGVFTMPGLVASVSGPLAIFAVLIMGFITALFLYVIGKLGEIYPRAGAIYYFAREALGDLAGFITGLSFYACSFIGTAPIIYGFILYLSYFVPGLAIGLTLTSLGIALAIAILAIVTLINIIGVRYGAGLNFVLTVGKIIPLLIFVAMGLANLSPGNFQPIAPYGVGSIGLAIAFGFWMFVGFEGLVLVGEEVKEPRKIIMKAAMLTVVIVSIVYLLVMSSFIGAVKWSALGIAEKDWSSLANLSSPLADVSKALGIAFLPEIVIAGAVISTAGCFSDWVLLQARVAFALARENRLWKPLSRVSPKFGTPVNALIFSSALTAIMMILIPSFPNIVLVTMIAEFIPYAISSLSYSVKSSGGVSILLGFLGFFLGSLYIYWACWPWTLTGSVVAIASLILYPLFVKNIKVIASELRKNTWYITYLVGLPVISLLGDSTFVYNNFLPISPLNVFRMPLDVAAVLLFSIAIYTWALKTNKVEIYEQKCGRLHRER